MTNKRLTPVENFTQLAISSGLPIGFLIEIANLWNSLSQDERNEVIENESCF